VIERWYLISAFETKAPCDAQWDYVVRGRLGQEFDVAGGLAKAVWDNFQCLPDTVDPRAPKGK
jgi:hypothetical protein